MGILNKLKSCFYGNKTPIIKDNTFIIWEPCSSSHAEVVPGYAKYLLELGYHVSILVTPERLKEGLFCRFTDENISYNQMTQKQIRKFFLKNPVNNVKGVLVTTIGKLCDNNIEEAYNSFNKDTDKSKIHFVEHEIDKLADNNQLKESIITLREMNYKNSKTTVVNPHYFGDIKTLPKNKITNFVTIGSLSEKRKNTQLLVEAVKEVINQGYTNFKVTVIGKGKISSLPNELRQYFDIRGRLPFDKMYDEIEKSDFILTAHESNATHRKYITIKTSGVFQLVYGFLKPVIIKEEFAPINGFDNSNAILYKQDNNYSQAMIKGINMSQTDYTDMQNSLSDYAKSLFNSSKNNLKQLINI